MRLHQRSAMLVEVTSNGIFASDVRQNLSVVLFGFGNE